MADVEYYLTAPDVVRLRQLLLAYEQGRLNFHRPIDYKPENVTTQVYLANIGSIIGTDTTGQATICQVDIQTQAITQITDLPTKTVFNLSTTTTIPTGYAAIVKEPSSGVWLAFPLTSTALAVYNYGPTTLIDAAVTRLDEDTTKVISFSEIAAGHVQFVVTEAQNNQWGVVTGNDQTW